MKKNKVFSLFVCLLLCAAIMFSYIFVSLEAHHDCIEEHCQICVVLHKCESIIRDITCTGIILALSIYIFLYSDRISNFSFKLNKADTLVSLKVMLLN